MPLNLEENFKAWSERFRQRFDEKIEKNLSAMDAKTKEFEEQAKEVRPKALADMKAKRLNFLRFLLEEPLSDKAASARDKLMLTCLVALAIEKLGMIPKTFQSLELSNDAQFYAKDIIIVGVFYLWYLFIARSLVTHLSRRLEEENDGGKGRAVIQSYDKLGNVIGLLYAFRVFMEIGVPHLLAIYTIYQVNGNPFFFFRW